MRVQNEHLTLPADPAGGDIAPYLRVKLDTGVVAVANAVDGDWIGTLEARYKSSGLGKSDNATVLSRNAPGTRKCVAAEALALHAAVHTADGGKVADTAAAGSFPYGIALQAATADGDIIEVLTFGGRPAANP